MIKKIFFVSFFLLNPVFLQSASIRLHGKKDEFILLHRLNGKKGNYETIGFFSSQRTLTLPIGSYLITNDCSQKTFQIQNPKEEHSILFHELQFKKHHQTVFGQDQSHVESFCYHPLTKELKVFRNKKNWLFLQDYQASLQISGQTFSFDHPPSSKKKIQTLYPLLLKTPLAKEKKTKQAFFFQKKEKNTKAPFLFRGETDTVTWLLPGSYEMELHQSKKSIRMGKKPKQINIASFYLKTPSHFSQKNHFLQYTLNQSFFDFNKYYDLFPDQYTIKLPQSDLSFKVELKPFEHKTIQTRSLIFCPPPQIKKKVRLTIHETGKVYALMKAQSNEPLLLFEGRDYSYSLQGSKGLMKKIDPLSRQSIHFGALKLDWIMKSSKPNHIKTEYIRIKGESPDFFGMSLDLLALKDPMIFLPPGSFKLSSFLLEGSHNRREIPFFFNLKQKEIFQKKLFIYTEQSLNEENHQKVSYLEPLQ